MLCRSPSAVADNGGYPIFNSIFIQKYYFMGFTHKHLPARHSSGLQVEGGSRKCGTGDDEEEIIMLHTALLTFHTAELERTVAVQTNGGRLLRRRSNV